MDVACRDCCPLLVGTLARTELGEGREWVRRGRGRLNGRTSKMIKNDCCGKMLYIRERWVRWFHKLLNIKSPTLDLSIADDLTHCPPVQTTGRCII